MRLPALELRDGVPTELRTIIVVPTLLIDIAGIREQIERLEVHHLSNPDGEFHLRAALRLDATPRRNTLPTTPNCSSGRARDRAAERAISRRRQHAALPSAASPAASGTRAKRKWIGWERKRGKLHELNRLLRGATDTTFVAIDGQRRRCRQASATSSRSTPTRACRSARRGAWSARWRIRSTGRVFDPASGPRRARPRASCSRA